MADVNSRVVVRRQGSAGTVGAPKSGTVQEVYQGEVTVQLNGGQSMVVPADWCEPDTQGE